MPGDFFLTRIFSPQERKSREKMPVTKSPSVTASPKGLVALCIARLYAEYLRSTNASDLSEIATAWWRKMVK
jgi:hypothetical protein